MAESTLKRLITEDTLMIEAKFFDATLNVNRLHILMASNADWVVPVAIDDRGRFAVADVSSKYKNDKSYFVPLYQEIDNGGGAAMLYDLLHMDLQGWHPRYDVPKTAALRDQKELSLSAADQWWYEMLKSGALARYDDKNVKNHPRFAPSRTLMDTARKTVPGLRFESDHMLGRILGKKGCLKQRIENVCGWRFPDLKEARATRDEQMPGTRWEDQEEWGVAEPF